MERNCKNCKKQQKDGSCKLGTDGGKFCTANKNKFFIPKKPDNKPA